MKVLFLSSRYAPHGLGGAERVTATLATSLTAVGHDVVVLTTAQEGDAPERTVDGVRVRAIPLRNVYDFSAPGSPVLKPVWHLLDSFNPLMMEAVGRAIDEERPDVLHSHLVTGFSPSVWDVAAKRGVPIVHTLHDHYVVCARSSMGIGDTPCERRHLRCALLSKPRVRAAHRIDAVVGVSRYILDRHREFGALLSNRSWVIPNPCHLVGRRVPLPAQLAPEQPGVRFGFLGRINVSKGTVRLLEATRALPQSGWSLTIAGEGEPDFVAGLRREFEGPRVSFVGKVDPVEFLRRIDVLIVPSTVPESFGMSAAEALAMGVPVAASRIAALPELIHEGRNGFLFPPDADGALNGVLARIIENPAMLSAMADACRRSVADLDASRVTARYLEVYEAVTS